MTLTVSNGLADVRCVDGSSALSEFLVSNDSMFISFRVRDMLRNSIADCSCSRSCCICGRASCCLAVESPRRSPRTG
jgi:hypothetical protein